MCKLNVHQILKKVQIKVNFQPVFYARKKTLSNSSETYLRVLILCSLMEECPVYFLSSPIWVLPSFLRYTDYEKKLEVISTAKWSVALQKYYF